MNDPCVICMQAYEANEIMACLPCGHSYHENCIQEWHLQEKQQHTPRCSCPICRRQYRFDDIYDITTYSDPDLISWSSRGALLLNWFATGIHLALAVWWWVLFLYAVVIQYYFVTVWLGIWKTGKQTCSLVFMSICIVVPVLCRFCTRLGTIISGKTTKLSIKPELCRADEPAPNS